MSSLLEVNGLTKRFEGLIAVGGVDLELTAGGRVGLIGPNGAGKTTFVNCVCGDLRPSDGRVVFDGRDVTGRPSHALFAAGLTRTYQVVNPFPGLTVLGSASLGALVHGRDVRRAEELGRWALDRLELSGRVDALMSSLTIMEMKKVELARIMASRPKLVFLDEVLAGLRPTEVNWLLDVLRELATEQAWTVVMIEHLVGAVSDFCDRIVVFDEGVVIADGTPGEVLADDRVISAYLGDRWKARA